jgi:hypothetical protein
MESIAENSYYDDMTYDSNMLQAGANESDQGSEELEEGEWVPDEPLRIVDGSLLDGADQALEERRDDNYNESRSWEGVDPDDREYFGDVEDDGLEDGEIEQDNEVGTNDSTGESAMEAEEGYSTEDGQKKEEEQWQAQFGQVVKEKATQHSIPGSIDLWDWAIVEMEPHHKTGKISKKLVGRIASSVTKLVSASSGLIRTSVIRAAEIGFVKVSSGSYYSLLSDFGSLLKVFFCGSGC